MKKWYLAAIAVTLLLGQPLMAAPELNPDHPDSYVVQKGDTLWGIAGKFLRDPWKWPEIWQANPQVENPHLIYPGDQLTLVYLDQQPRLVVTKQGPVKLSPTVRSEPLDNAIPAIPLDKINAFLRNSRFVMPEELVGAPYVVAGEQRHIVVGAGSQLYARGDFSSGEGRYGVYREGEIYKSKKTGEVLGLHMLSVGQVKQRALEGDLATMEILSTSEEVRVGDLLLPPLEEALSSIFQPSAPAAEVSGTILGVEKGVTSIGPMDVVMIDLGRREGVVAGNVMAVYKLGETVPDPQTGEMIKLPDERAGLLMFFRVYEKMGFALVLSAQQALAVDDLVRMP